MIQFESVTRKFGDFTAVSDLSFEIQRGTGITALLGPNGAGKSTSMRLLTGYLKATRGNIRLNGLSLNNPRNAVEVKKSIGYLPESSPLYPEMLVSEYLAFIGGVRGLKGSDLDRRIQEMTERLELGSHFYTPLGYLSKGFRQRVALAGTLIHDPEIIVLDEPTSGLDPNQISHIRKLIKELGKNRTLLLSTHIMQEVEDLCDRVIVISRGKIVADGSMEELRGAGSIELVVRGEGIEGILSGSPLVTTVERSGKTLENDFEVFYINPGSSPPEELFRFIAGQGWDVRSFSPGVRSLQDIFQELTG